MEDGRGQPIEESRADHLPVIICAHQIGTGPFQVTTYGFDSPLEVSTGDRIVKVSVVGIVFRDPIWGQDLVSHCTPLSVAANFIDQLAEPDDQAVSRAFSQGQMKLAVGQSERRWVVCRTFDLFQCAPQPLYID